MPSVYEPRPRPRTWKEHRSGIRRRWAVPFHWIEWLTQWMAYYLSNWSLLEVLEYAGRFTVLIAVIVYFMEAPDRRKQKHYQAWQVINSAQGQSGGGGRVEALQELHDDGVSLIAVNVEGAYLQGLSLPGADLSRSYMARTDLRDCRLTNANLEDADLNNANLRGGDLRHVAFARASLSKSDLHGANLEGAELMGADLDEVDLSAANLRELKWKEIASIKGADISDIRNAPEGFIEWALANGAVNRAPSTRTTTSSTERAR